MKVFSIDVQIAGTVYIRAKTKKAAKEILDNFLVENFTFEAPAGGIIADHDYDHPLLPDASMSPAMTLEKTMPGQKLEWVMDVDIGAGS